LQSPQDDLICHYQLGTYLYPLLWHQISCHFIPRVIAYFWESQPFVRIYL
jgi:hypothetical protein